MAVHGQICPAPICDPTGRTDGKNLFLQDEIKGKEGVQDRETVDKINEAAREANGGSLIFITAQYDEEKSGYYSNFFLSPIMWETQEVVGGHIIRYDKDKHPFRDYLAEIRYFDFYLHNPVISNGFEKLIATNSRVKSFLLTLRSVPAEGIRLKEASDGVVTDNSGHTLACIAQINYDVDLMKEYYESLERQYTFVSSVARSLFPTI
jgi:hypothetical protein